MKDKNLRLEEKISFERPFERRKEEILTLPFNERIVIRNRICKFTGIKDNTLLVEVNNRRYQVHFKHYRCTFTQLKSYLQLLCPGDRIRLINGEEIEFLFVLSGDSFIGLESGVENTFPIVEFETIVKRYFNSEIEKIKSEVRNYMGQQIMTDLGWVTVEALSPDQRYVAFSKSGRVLYLSLKEFKSVLEYNLKNNKKGVSNYDNISRVL